jgi:hypothetical protein
MQNGESDRAPSIFGNWCSTNVGGLPGIDVRRGVSVEVFVGVGVCPGGVVVVTVGEHMQTPRGRVNARGPGLPRRPGPASPVKEADVRGRLAPAAAAVYALR